MTARITLFASDLNHTIETIAFYLTYSEDCCVRIVTRFDGDEKSEHPWSLRRLRATNCELIEIGSPPKESDLFIFGLVRHGKIPREVTAWKAISGEAAFLLPDEFYDGYMDRLRELVRSWPHYLGASRVIYRHARIAKWRTFPFYLQKAVYYSPYLHPQLFTPDELNNAFNVASAVNRRFRMGFLGNRNPTKRAQQLAQCRQAIDDLGIRIIDSTSESWGENQAVWVEYGDSETTGQRGLDPREYLDVLAEMDFCICPTGWRKYTHRTVEAIVRGAVPILEDPRAYDLGLRDGENCIVVRDDNWLYATSRALGMSQSEVVQLRKSVLALSEEKLVPRVAAKHFCSQLLH